MYWTNGGLESTQSKVRNGISNNSFSPIRVYTSIYHSIKKQTFNLNTAVSIFTEVRNSYQYQCDFKQTADVTITHNFTQVPSNTLMTRYERVVNILKIPLKWKK